MKIITVFIAITILSISPNLLAGNYCGDLSTGGTDGPYDYTIPHRRIREIEGNHFNQDVENLISGMTGTIGAEIDFLLRYVPNHHRALLSLSKLSLRDKTNKPAGARYTVLCFFERAIRFKPDDATVHYLFSGYLLETDKFDMALEQLNIASKLEPNNPAINYNLGLLYFQKKNYDKALHFAKKAYSQNFPLPGLKNKLTSVGRWKN